MPTYIYLILNVDGQTTFQTSHSMLTVNVSLLYADVACFLEAYTGD